MNTAREIEAAIRSLPSEELAALRAWFAEYDAENWDRSIEQDAVAGRLNDLAEEALRDLRDGRCTDL